MVSQGSHVKCPRVSLTRDDRSKHLVELRRRVHSAAFQDHGAITTRSRPSDRLPGLSTAGGGTAPLLLPRILSEACPFVCKPSYTAGFLQSAYNEWEMLTPQGADPSARQWRLLSSHGTVLIYIGLRPGCTVAELSGGLSLTSRTVYGTLGDLREAGLLNVRKEGRRHHYSVNYGGRVVEWLEPGGAELRHLLRLLANRALAVLDEDSDS